MSSEHPPRQGPIDEHSLLLIHNRLEEIRDCLDEGDIEGAVSQAQALVVDFPESGDAHLGLAETRYEIGDVRGTLEAAERAAALGTEDDQLRQWYLAAAHHYMWDFTRAREILREITCDEIECGAAWYLLAQVCETEGDEVGARRGYEKAFGIEPDRFPRPHRIDDPTMRDAVQAARDDLPPRFQEVLDELAVVIEPLPNRELAQPENESADPIPPDVLGLFVGNNQLDKSVFNAIEHPGVIFLFQRNLERVCADRMTLIEEIRTTLLHELAHYLGFEEEHMADLGLE